MGLFDKNQNEPNEDAIGPEDVAKIDLNRTPQDRADANALKIVFNEGIDDLRKSELIPDGTYIAEITRRTTGYTKTAGEPYIIVNYKYVGVVDEDGETQDPDRHLVGRTDDQYYSLVEGRRGDFFDLLAAILPSGLSPQGEWSPDEVVEPGLRFKGVVQGYRSKRGRNAGKWVARMKPVNAQIPTQAKTT